MIKGGKVVARLNDFLFNASLLGFYRMVEGMAGVSYRNNQLEFPVDLLLSFEDIYFDKMVERYEDTTVVKKICDDYSRLTYSVQDEEFEKQVDRFMKYAKDKLGRNSYKSAYECINREELEFSLDVMTLLRDVDKLDIPSEKISAFAPIFRYLSRNYEMLAMKDIAYNQIVTYWKNMAFLNRSSSKRNMKECYRKVFVEPVEDFLTKQRNGRFQCIECGEDISKTEGFTMAWLNDIGIDLKRKTSYYWNFQADTLLCPMCALIYSCIPMGFATIGKQGLFVNQNDSFRHLVSANALVLDEVQNMESLEQMVYQKLLDLFANQSSRAQTEEVINVQVVKRIEVESGSTVYSFNHLSREKLNVLKACGKDFQNLTRAFLKTSDGYIRVYSKVIKNFFQGRNQYGLLDEVIRLGFVEHANIWCTRHILSIQNRVIEGGRQMGVSDKQLNFMQFEGGRLRQAIAGDERMRSDLDNKLRGYVFRLLNALNVRDVNRFMDTALRMYAGLGKPVPRLFVDMLKDQEAFMLLGYAYVLGLKGDTISSQEDRGNKND